MIVLCIIAALVLIVLAYIRLPKFGALPAAERLERAQKSPNFRDGKFQNLSHTPDLTEGTSYLSVMKEFLFGKKNQVKPPSRLPSKKTDLLALDPSENVVVWFGHSSYFMQIDGKKMLVDPVFSGAASPMKFSMPSFPGSDVYSVADLPDIDFLFISHDHWDHIDHETLVELRPKVGKIICGLGVGAHFERWGYAKSQVFEKDWHGHEQLAEGFEVTAVPARHFSGRGFSRNRSLWVAYVLKTPSLTIFVGGDSGYDTHFAEIGQKYGPFDLAMLECGQYDKSWKYIHMMPEEVVLAAQDLRARAFFPIHWGKFALGNHDWDEPIRRVSAAAEFSNVPMVTPMIGEKLVIGEARFFEKWWEKLTADQTETAT